MKKGMFYKTFYLSLIIAFTLTLFGCELWRWFPGNGGGSKSAKAITAFSFTSPSATGAIDEANYTIAVTVPYETVVTALVPTITHTGKSINPASGVAKDFSSPVTYTVTAADASTQAYTVTVTELAAYTQADLTGTWHMRALKAGASNKYYRAIFTVDSSGYLTFSSCNEWVGGSTPCPAAGLMRWTIDANGVISVSGTAGNPTSHYTMTSNKNFIAGTSTSGSDYELKIFQKEVTGTVYSNADLQNKTFVDHSLNFSVSPEWKYGTGTMDAAGQVTFTSQTNPSGTTNPGATGITFSMDAFGVVTIPDSDWNGFLSDDKKTIVWTDENQLGVIQITGGATFTGGASVNFAHRLGHNNTTHYWIHYTSSVDDSGLMTFIDWVSSNGSTAPTGTFIRTVSPTGVITVSGTNFHGQVSNDYKFSVGVGTGSGSTYQLTVTTK